MKFTQKNNYLLLKNGRKILGFIGKNGNHFYYAFGTPTGANCAFFVDNIEIAKNRLLELV